MGVGVGHPAHEAGEGRPGVAVVGQGLLGGGDVDLEPVAAEPAQQLLLAGVAPWVRRTNGTNRSVLMSQRLVGGPGRDGLDHAQAGW
jgi:hypothetical protein